MMICHCAIPAMGGSCINCPRYEEGDQGDPFNYDPTPFARPIIEKIDYDLLAKKVAKLLAQGIVFKKVDDDG